jgi:hypothetical protein
MPLTWRPKDPDDVIRYGVNWSDFLAPGDKLVTSSLTVVSGTAVVSGASYTDTAVQASVSGGTDGETTIFLNHVETEFGEKKDETIYLSVVSTTAAPLSGYTAPTEAQFLARFPRFADVDPGAIGIALTEAEGMVDETWAAADFAMGRMLWAAHVLTLDGLGTGAEAQAAAAGTAGFKVMKSGALSLERFEGSKTGAASTSYGQRWLDMARRNRGGPVIAIAPQPPYNALAFDGDPWPY